MYYCDAETAQPGSWGFHGSLENNSRLIKWLVLFRRFEFSARRFACKPLKRLSTYEEKALRKEVTYLNERHIDSIHDDDADYPDMFLEYFGERRPETLFYMGRKSLLTTPSIMVCGSRESSQYGLDIARSCGRIIAQRGWTMVSGYARGVDRAAHYGAFEGGGKTLAFLPYGMSRFRVPQQLAPVFDEERFCVVSEVSPLYGFSTHSAFRRNKMLAAMSEAVIVVEPGESGGSWYSAQKAAEMGKPLFYFEGERMEVMDKMAPLGGIRLTVNDGVPDLAPMFEVCRKIT